MTSVTGEGLMVTGSSSGRFVLTPVTANYRHGMAVKVPENHKYSHSSAETAQSNTVFVRGKTQPASCMTLRSFRTQIHTAKLEHAKTAQNFGPWIERGSSSERPKKSIAAAIPRM